ncbi:putative 50S ribosome-binding GTPase [Lyophyllum shimeji]|uniref:50S ribosome-binding GTPase n=1 Tax=Lyophyllum shimeji TaxID=47721 RepID=A0A9P3PPJ5_LYOSH|nr:putative 50S ribosome-binding GTPase [Lyophyllum shimeji]
MPRCRPRRAKQREQKRRAAESLKDKFVRDGTQGDIVIPLMGPTGAGKSTFINAVLGDQGERMPVGRKLTSCTAHIDWAVVDPKVIRLPPGFEHCRVIMVDTPGFDDTYEGDADILRRIAQWLETSYRNQESVLAGVIYLHDISHDRFSGTARRNLEMFKHLCGNPALSKVVLGTTKWERLVGVEGEEREHELIKDHWRSVIDAGAQVRRFLNTPKSAREFVEDVLARHAKNTLEGAVLEIQEELVVDRKIIPETEAGRELRYTLKEVLEMQKQMAALEADIAKAGDSDAKVRLEETRKKLRGISEALNDLKIPFVRRILTMFRCECSNDCRNFV